MAKKKNTFPVATQPLEYIAFFSVKLSTKEGPAFIFMAYDAYSDFIFNLSVESNERPTSVLKNIYYLMEDPYFESHIQKGFTIVMDRYEELSDNLMQILSPVGGKLMFDKLFNNYLSQPVLKNLSEYMNNHSK
jgi:hypothetical protein